MTACAHSMIDKSLFSKWNEYMNTEKLGYNMREGRHWSNTVQDVPPRTATKSYTFTLALIYYSERPEKSHKKCTERWFWHYEY